MEEQRKMTFFVCPGCRAVYNTPKTICLICNKQLDAVGEPNGLQRFEILPADFDIIIKSHRLEFSGCSCSGDHYPGCVSNI